MNSVPDQHRHDAPAALGCAVLTVSDTRTLDTDEGGKLACELLTGAGHRLLAREIVRDEPDLIGPAVVRWATMPEIEAILLTGGTGLGRRDRTYETILALLEKPIPGYGELFRMLSFAEIGPAAMLSRALGGVVQGTVVLTMPGSPAAVRLALERLILPELGHLVREVRR